MITPRCNKRCIPKKGLHWLGDVMIKEEDKERACVDCGAIGQPHFGFTTPCSMSASGSHHFKKRRSVMNNYHKFVIWCYLRWGGDMSYITFLKGIKYRQDDLPSKQDAVDLPWATS